MRKSYLVDIISYLLIILFIYAAVSKLNEFQKFRAELGQSPILTATAGYLVWMVPITEIIIAIMLSINSLRIFGLYAGFSLMTMFTAYIIEILNFSFYIPCSCGGIIQNLSWSSHLNFNIFFTLAALVGIILETKSNILPSKKIAYPNL